MATSSTDLTEAIWRKSTRSNNGGACVEVADNLPGIVAVRDSRDPRGPALLSAPPSGPRSSPASGTANSTNTKAPARQDRRPRSLADRPRGRDGTAR